MSINRKNFMQGAYIKDWFTEIRLKKLLDLDKDLLSSGSINVFISFEIKHGLL